MSNYQKRKESAREEAIDWQQWLSENPISWGCFAIAGEYFEKLAKRYGLIKEFRENGII